jgi:hypothetical protein
LLTNHAPVRWSREKLILALGRTSLGWIIQLILAVNPRDNLALPPPLGSRGESASLFPFFPCFDSLIGGCLMRKSRFNRLLLFVLLMLSMTILASPQPKPAVEVWAVASGENKVYHCPGSRWFGVGSGKKVSECQAIQEGYRPAFGSGCGSACLQSSKLETRGSAQTCRIEQSKNRGGFYGL